MKGATMTRPSGMKAAAIGTALMAVSTLAKAEITDLANAPLINSSTTAVLPNLMFVLDNSGSMDFDFTPDNVYYRPGGPHPYGTLPGGNTGTGKERCLNSSCSSKTDAIKPGDPPYYSAQFNTQFYNPQITYKPGLKADGTSYGDQSITAARDDPYRFPTGSTTDLTKSFPETVYCKGSSDNANNDANYPDKCKRHGIEVLSPFLYDSNSAANGLPDGAVSSTSSNYKFPRTRNSNPHYFTIKPREWCADSTLVDCAGSSGPTATHPVPAYVRYCQSASIASDGGVVSGTSGGKPKCQAKYDSSTHRYVRYGKFTRTDIVPAKTNYGGETLWSGAPDVRANRTDCAAPPNCTYEEEARNFANWWSYYRTRMLMMKTAAGRAFNTIGDAYRVGFITINPGSPVSSSQYLKLDKFDATHKGSWYSKFYAISPGGGTPLREALSRVGRHYAGVTTGINNGMPDDPVQFSCQQNFTLLTTDGYWNSNAGQKIDGTSIGNQDNVDSGYSKRSDGAYDGGLSGASNTLADVAMYYYKTDLRPSLEDNVPTTSRDPAAHQHMVTFTLGLGLSGLMDYRSDYETATSGDFYKIKTATKGCSWGSPGAVCNWPVPVADSSSALDDLWHAAVNGRGIYFSATDPNSLSSGIAGSLSALSARTGAAAAAATSSPNVTETDNFIYSSTFRTVKWDGEIVAQRIDPATGNVVSTLEWSTTGGPSPLNSKVSSTSDTRTIYTFDSGAATKLKAFSWAGLTSGEQGYFNNKVCGTFSQCSSLTDAQKSEANKGQNLVNYLRGQTQHEGTLYRDRELTLGDPVSAKPVYVKAPRFGFTSPATPDYAAFKVANGARQAMLYVAANDGMLHAFNADTGEERWAYVPRMLLPNLYKLAEANYAATHSFFVDGSPQVMDVVIGGAWRTILVGGLNAGGRGYYALDITDPANPKALWEICHDSTLCAVSDPDMGYSYGNPVITQRPTDGKWVVLVTSGYNNVSPGTGRGYLFILDAGTGAVLRKVDTGVGDTATPSGLAKISAYADDFNLNNTAKWVYGGDLLGNVWRFDLQTDPPGVLKIAELKDGSGKPQSVTVSPELGLVLGHRVVYVGTGRYLGVNDLVDPATLGLPYAYQQSIYAIKDSNVAHGNFRASGAVQQTITQLDPTTRTISNNPVDWTSGTGWYVDLNPANLSPGERVNLDPQLVLGTLVVASNIPSATPCTVGGESWIYQFNYATGGYVATAPSHIVATKLPGNTLAVGMVIVRLPSGQLKVITTGAAGNKETLGVHTGGGGGGGRKISWRELIK